MNLMHLEPPLEVHRLQVKAVLIVLLELVGEVADTVLDAGAFVLVEGAACA